MTRSKAWAGALALGMAATMAMAMAGSGPARAADGRPVDTPIRLLERMDRDLDGKISFEEYRNAMLKRFDANDKNGDGVLDTSEYPKEWVAGADTRAASGKISWADFGDALQPTFNRFDGDHDGKLDGAEIAAFAAARQAREGARK
jgi:Ca2+-binding EF-hand superfamily protein